MVFAVFVERNYILCFFYMKDLMKKMRINFFSVYVIFVFMKAFFLFVVKSS